MSNGLSRRNFLKVSLLSALGTTLFGVGGFAYAYDVEPRWVEVVNLRLPLPRLSPAFEGYRIAQISDIHLGTGLTPERLLGVVELINDQQPDLVVITGDFVTHGPIEWLAPGLVDSLSQLRPKDGAFAVLGNHDYWTDVEAIRQVLRDSGLIELSNAVYTLQRGEAMLHIAGIDDHWERQDRLDDVLRRLPDDGAAILLAHEPDFADISAATGRFDLQLSGHSHGGQVIVPFVGPLALPRLGRKYPMGFYQVGNMIQYTNRGIGTIAPAVRFNCRPEITVFSLSAAAR